MATTGHESEAINVQGLKASLQKLKTDHIDGKADKATTLAGYGITDAYTKSETYTKTEVNGLVDTPHQNYVTVSATSQTTAATDVLPASGQAADTIYRVSNWDGSASSGAGAFDVTKYSEYAWDDQSNPNKYVFLCVKTAIGEVFDISVYNNNATYADLAAALGVDGANVPADIRRGGMSVKFVHSVDNKYVQWRLMADEWNINTNDWAIAEEGVYIENPEFVYVKTDAEGKILWAIKTDGGIYYGAGVPQQVIDYINEKIADFSPDEYEDIVAFLADLEKGDKTLSELLYGKVDKEDGKTLIPAQYIQEVENPEFISVDVDAEGKIIEAVEKDGTKLFGGNVKVLSSIDINGVTYKVVSNPEWLKVVIDAEDRIICGIKINGKFVVYSADFLDDIEAIKTRLKELDAYSVTENPEFIEVELDAEDKILGGRKTDGTKFENNDVELNGNVTVGGSLEVDGVAIKNIGDPEGRLEISTDSEDKIISYRKEDGTLVENVGIETNHLELTEQGMNDFQQALKAAGFRPGGCGNWSDYDSQDGDYPLVLPMPKCAIVNIISDYDLTQLSKEGYSANPPFWPAGVEGETYDIPAQVEFYDCLGNYFKKWTKMSGQGNSSMVFPKKNIAFDFFDDDTFDGAFTTRFGDWVEQDSYHLKSFPTDAFRCVSPVTYQLYDEMIQTRGIYNDYFWKRALIDFSTITATSNGSANLDDADLKFESGARCFPKGFPCLVFQNGVFWGVYSFQLKKNRKNYHQEKEVATHIQLDGTIDGNTLLNANGVSANISWIPGNDNGFEVRNPKADNFVTANGQKYMDYATTSQELAGLDVLGDEVENYDATKTYDAFEKCVKDGRMYLSRVAGNVGNDPANASYGSKVKDVWKKATAYWIEITYTNSVKVSILTLSTYLTNLAEANAIYEASSKTAEDKQAFKDLFETYVDPDNLIDYLVIADTVGGISAAKNWQWLTYDGIKWYIGLYDCDNALGQYFEVTETRRSPNTQHTIQTMFHAYILKYYNAELEAQYKTLRDAGIISVDHIVELVKDWQGKIGKKYFMIEFKKWTDTTRFDSLFRLEKWISTEITNMDSVYHYSN